MTNLFLFCILGIVIGGFITFIVLKPKLKAIEQIDEQTLQENERIKILNEQLLLKKVDLESQLLNLKLDKARLDASIAAVQEEAQKASDIIYNASKATAEAQFELAAQDMSSKFQNYEKECQEEYVNALKDVNIEFQNQLKLLLKERDDIQTEINNLSLELQNQAQITKSAIAANKRAMEENDKKNFYRINLSAVDLEEIEKLRSIAPLLRNREPLDKVIWKTYYERPTAQLIGRVVGLEIKVGIYKITDLSTGMTYIGQSVNIADRFKAHIKAGLGIDSSNNKLYTTMREKGVENFTFEILEECNRIDLNTKERFWIEFYQSESFGMNSTKGNK